MKIWRNQHGLVRSNCFKSDQPFPWRFQLRSPGTVAKNCQNENNLHVNILRYWTISVEKTKYFWQISTFEELNYYSPILHSRRLYLLHSRLQKQSTVLKLKNSGIMTGIQTVKEDPCAWILGRFLKGKQGIISCRNYQLMTDDKLYRRWFQHKSNTYPYSACLKSNLFPSSTYPIRSNNVLAKRWQITVTCNYATYRFGKNRHNYEGIERYVAMDVFLLKEMLLRLNFSTLLLKMLENIFVRLQKEAVYYST